MTGAGTTLTPVRAETDGRDATPATMFAEPGDRAVMRPAEVIEATVTLSEDQLIASPDMALSDASRTVALNRVVSPTVRFC